MDWVDLRLWWHNLWLPIRNWRIRRELMPEWIAEGRDPKMFPRTARIDRAAYNWAAAAVLDKADEEIGAAMEDDLIGAYDKYIKLLEDECGKLYSFAWTHGFICPDEVVKSGERCRAKIAELKVAHGKT